VKHHLNNTGLFYDVENFFYPKKSSWNHHKMLGVDPDFDKTF